ncbi:MgtC/SapB family protein [Paenibacillus nanensis]|uniref:MgtC/SapB family protein n=1 Tax=Paenibacillus nanensis TaxID=393251 RepID=A0A3A1UKS1_9BACL|nr:MgtC/SapB family protein [Paenibacillus nanensis]RIX47278.1 MgtC/SapB family protein [Paenibacillus nanensis]
MLSATHNPWFISELDILIRLSTALLLGGLIGLEREQSNHAAGLRTNILVCLGACLLMLLSIYGFSDFVKEANVRVDPARLAAAVITGVGFLGAGTILFTGKSITGLTTAASLWVVAAIGLAVGAGFYFASASVTVMVLLTLWLFNKLEKRYIKGKKEFIIKVQSSDISLLMSKLTGMLNDRNITVRKMHLEDVEEDDDRNAETVRTETRLIMHITMPNRHNNSMTLIDDLKKLEGIRWVSSE